MRYSLERAFFNYTQNLKKTYWVIVQLIVGCAVIACCLNYSISSGERYLELLSQIEPNQYRIDAYVKNINADNDYPAIRYSDYIELSALIEDADLSYIAYGATLTEEPFYLVFADSCHYTKLGLTNTDSIYVGKSVARFCGDEPCFLTTFCKLENDSIVLDNAAFSWKTFPAETEEKIVVEDLHSGNTLLTERSILIPAHLINQAMETSEEMLGTGLTFKIPDDTDMTRIKEIKERICSFLSDRHGDFEFAASGEQTSEIQSRMNDMKINYDSFLWISVFLMIIVALGTIGNALIILLKRKRSLAISLAVGATPRQLFLEFLSEVFLTIQTGVLLGLAVSAFITPQLSNTFCVVKNHVLTWLIVIAGGTLTTLLVSAVSYLLFRTEPSRTIHGI